MERTKEEKQKPFLDKRVLILTLSILACCLVLMAVGILVGAYQINRSAAEADRGLTAEALSSAEEVDLANALRIATVNHVFAEEAIPAYTNAQIRQMDMSQPSGVTVSDLKLVTRGGLVGLESAFVKAEQDYGVNCLFVMSIASLESANGTICFRPNNMFGFGQSGFSSKAEGIDVVSRALARNYLSPGGSLYSGKTIADVNKRYASSSTWDDKVANNMTRYYSVISKHHNAALEKLR